MLFRSKALILLICLFLISFKVAAGSIFIDAALERAHLQQNSFSSSVSDQGHISKEATDGEQQPHTLFLMSHVTANISEVCIAAPFVATQCLVSSCPSTILFTQNFPDSAFKPPKANA